MSAKYLIGFDIPNERLARGKPCWFCRRRGHRYRRATIMSLGQPACEFHRAQHVTALETWLGHRS